MLGTQPAASPSDDTVEVVAETLPPGPFRAALFDFDGTLSLLRRNWQDVMIPMMVEILQETGTDESPEELYRVVEEFVMRLNGRQTIYQMMQLAEEVRKRGGQPEDPLCYKHRYHQRLAVQVEARIRAVREGRTAPDEMMVPGAREWLAFLCEKGLALYLASGTDLQYVQEELEVLGLHPYFQGRVYGALDEYWRFSKAQTIQKILAETGVSGEQIVAFGDGFVEMEETRKVGGLAVGVASNEQTRCGVNQWKRQRLIRAGAHLIIADYRCAESLKRYLHLDAP